MKCSLMQSNIIVSESFWQIFTKLSGSLNIYGLRTIYCVTSLASFQFFPDYNKVGAAEYVFCLTTWGTSTGICSWTISKYYSGEVHHITLFATSWGKKFALKDSPNNGGKKKKNHSEASLWAVLSYWRFHYGLGFQISDTSLWRGSRGRRAESTA